MPDAEPALMVISDLPRLPHRAATAHKGQVGRVAIIAGSRGMSGAAVLSGLGALRGGAGLVRVICPAEIQPIVAACEPCLMTDAISDEQAGVPGLGGLFNQRVQNWADVVAIGPGLGVSTLALNNVPDMLQESAVPLVIDADALNVLAEVPAWPTVAETDSYREWWRWRGGLPTVITPHPGEMLKLRRAAGLSDRTLDTNDANRLAVAAEYARLQKTVVVLKGHRTVVCDAPQDGVPPRAFINTTGNPGMAAGGMGDVLTGLIAALIGQGLSAFDAACLGVHCHGAAGDALAQEKGPIGFLAREVADRLPTILAQHISL